MSIVRHTVARLPPEGETRIYSPWLTFDRIINPWGLSGFPIHVRLPEGCLLEFVVRFVASSVVLFATALPVTRVGGRLCGRYWYNTAFGGH